MILSDVEQFSEFRNFSYFGDIAKGIQWANNNQDKLEAIVKNAQNYVKKNYSKEIVSERWKQVIETI